MTFVLPSLALTSLLLAAPHSAQPTVFDLRIHSGAVELAATLTVPPGDGRRPAVILMHGSGEGTRRGLQRFADHFNSLGYATLVYDKRGSGQSTGSWTTASLEDNVADAQAAFQLLQAHPGINPARIGVWGVSQAGWFIPVLAGRLPALAFAIVLTGGGATPKDVEMFMHRASLDRAGVAPADREEAERMLDAYFSWLGTGVGREAVVGLIAQAKTKPWFGAVAIDGVMPSDANRPNWAWVANFDPMPAIETMRVPTLVLLGGADRMGSTAVSNDRWTAGLARAGNAHAKVVVIEGMGHAATIGSEHKMGSATMPAYLTEVASFLQALPDRREASGPRDFGTST